MRPFLSRISFLVCLLTSACTAQSTAIPTAAVQTPILEASASPEPSPTLTPARSDTPAPTPLPF